MPKTDNSDKGTGGYSKLLQKKNILFREDIYNVFYRVKMRI
ncbi:MAG TPA: hypothetical protein VK489_11760 [Ferruginibacter sp.]|nr:hypothetical protein [Ferruginibacter sp.]